MPSAAANRLEDGNVEERLDRIASLMRELQEAVDRNQEAIRRNEELSKSSYDALARDRKLLRTEAAEKIHARLLGLEERFEWGVGVLSQLRVGGRHVFTRKTMATCAAILLAIYLAKSFIYDKLSSETAHFGKQVLDKNQKNLEDTIIAVTQNPDTLSALVGLVGRLLCDEATRRQLLSLLQYLLEQEATRRSLVVLLVGIFQDEALVRQTGKFTLEALDTEETRAMLHNQVQALVSATVSSEKVQTDTSRSVRRVLGQTLRFW